MHKFDCDLSIVLPVYCLFITSLFIQVGRSAPSTERVQIHNYPAFMRGNSTPFYTWFVSQLTSLFVGFSSFSTVPTIRTTIKRNLVLI